MEHVISLVEMIRSCCHVCFPKVMVGTLTLILVLFLGIEYIGYRFSWILRDGGDANFSWIREVFVGTIDGFRRRI